MRGYYASAFVYELADSHFWNNVVVGAAVAVLAACALWRTASAEDDRRYAVGLAAVLGLWMVAAPLVLGAGTGTGAFWSDVVSGALAAVIAGCDADQTGRRAPATTTGEATR